MIDEEENQRKIDAIIHELRHPEITYLTDAEIDSSVKLLSMRELKQQKEILNAKVKKLCINLSVMKYDICIRSLRSIVTEIVKRESREGVLDE